MHVEVKHSPWKYLYYIYYLYEKEEDDLTGIEQDCLEKFNRLNTSWLPIGNTYYHYEEDNDNDNLKVIESKLN